MHSETAPETASLEQETSVQSQLFDPFSQPFLIGDWRVDPKLNQLQQTGGSISRHLEPRLAKLLCYLAAHELEVVERDTLVSVLWPRVIVNENSLTRAVSELRKLLTLDTNPKRVYIETIPKRGYRLCTPVTAPSQDKRQPADSVALSWPAALPSAVIAGTGLADKLRQSSVAAFCLALTIGVMLQFGPENDSDNFAMPGYYDQLVYSSAQERLRDEVVLSSVDQESMESGNSTEPVLAQDENRFAYIHYDHTGSTIFLGEVDGEYEPVPVFNSRDILYNLGWSPLENALLFASKPALTTTALFDRELAEQAKLYSFDLESFRLSQLVEKAPTTQGLSDAELSLT
jgi:DNA-binding winged helix-turn-helix (wHTH) protein